MPAAAAVPSLKLHQNLEWAERETMRKALEQARAEFARANPQGRLIQPAEVADTVAWLVGAAGVNGQAIAVCGGETM